MNATQRPWKVAVNKRHVTDADGRIVVYPGGSRTERTAEANAALIVRAVNSYDAMRECLEQVILESEDSPDRIPHDIVRGAKAALALADPQEVPQ